MSRTEYEGRVVTVTGEKLGDAVFPVLTPKRGAPTKCTQDVIERVHDALAKGHTFASACTFGGISPATGYAWNKEATSVPERCPPEWVAFREACLRGGAEFQESCLSAILAKMPEDWRAAMALLERRFPKDWGRVEMNRLVDEHGKDRDWSLDTVRVEMARRIATNNGTGDITEAEVIDAKSDSSNGGGSAGSGGADLLVEGAVDQKSVAANEHDGAGAEATGKGS